MSSLLSEIMQDAEQGSDLWNKLRLGKFTSSRISEIICKKGELTKTALTYIHEKAVELLTGEDQEKFENEAMAWGKTHEPIARKLYEDKMNLAVTVPGFIILNEFYGGSLDGEVEPEGLIEIKCPFNSANHTKNCMIDSPAKFKKLQSDYFYQMQSNMNVADKSWGHFISFDPRIEKAPFYLIHIKRDEDAIKEINQAVENATVELQRILNHLSNNA